MVDKTKAAQVQLSDGGNKLLYGPTALEVFEAGSKKLTTSGIGTSPLGTMNTDYGAINIVEDRDGTWHRTMITLTNLVIAMVDATTNGSQGNQALYALPRGEIYLLGATSNLTLTGDGTGITTTSAVVGAVGSAVPAVDATLTSTEADVIPSTVCTLTASAGAMKGRGVTPKFFDNTTTTAAALLNFYLNFATPDAGSTANGTITVNGVVQFTWYNLGDN